MKKITALVLAALFCLLSLAGCEKNIGDAAFFLGLEQRDKQTIQNGPYYTSATVHHTDESGSEETVDCSVTREGDTFVLDNRAYGYNGRCCGLSGTIKSEIAEYRDDETITITTTCRSGDKFSQIKIKASYVEDDVEIVLEQTFRFDNDGYLTYLQESITVTDGSESETETYSMEITYRK